MPKFAVLINGVNFLIHDAAAPAPARKGFFITALLEAPGIEEAEAQAVELVRTSPDLRPLVKNSADDPPQMFVEEINELADWPDDTVRPLTGFAFYDDPGAVAEDPQTHSTFSYHEAQLRPRVSRRHRR
jgi:hypothetical protein